jgi:hypothetical protein
MHSDDDPLHFCIAFLVLHLDLHASHQTSHSAIELLLMQPSLLDNLSRAVRGNYGVVLSLLGCLDEGAFAKKLVDAVVDSCTDISESTILIISDLFGHSPTRR